MRQINTENMDKVAYKGQEIAFGKCRKNEYGEYVIKVYVDGMYDEDKTIYEESREDAEATKAAAIRDYSIREYKDLLAEAEDEDIANAELIRKLTSLTDEELINLGYHTYYLLAFNKDDKSLLTINAICGDIVTAREEQRMQG